MYVLNIWSFIMCQDESQVYFISDTSIKKWLAVDGDIS